MVTIKTEGYIAKITPKRLKITLLRGIVALLCSRKDFVDLWKLERMT